MKLGTAGGDKGKARLPKILEANYPMMQFEDTRGWSWDRIATEIKTSKFDQFKQAAVRDDFFPRFLKSFGQGGVHAGFTSPIKSQRSAVFRRIDDDIIEEKRKDLLKSISDMVKKSHLHQLKIKENRKKSKIFLREVGSKIQRSNSYNYVSAKVPTKQKHTDSTAQFSLLPANNSLAGVTNAAMKIQRMSECFVLSNMTPSRLETLVHRIMLEHHNVDVEKARLLHVRSKSSEQFEDGGPIRRKQNPEAQVCYKDLLTRHLMQQRMTGSRKKPSSKFSASRGTSMPGDDSPKVTATYAQSVKGKQRNEVPWYANPVKSRLHDSLKGLLHVISKYAVEKELYVLKRKGNSPSVQPRELTNNSTTNRGYNEVSKDTSLRNLGNSPNPNSVSISEVAEVESPSRDANSRIGNLSPRGLVQTVSRPTSMELLDDSLFDVLNLDRVKMLVNLSAKLEADTGISSLAKGRIQQPKGPLVPANLQKPQRKTSRSPTYNSIRIQIPQLSAVEEVDNSGEFQSKVDAAKPAKLIVSSKFKRKSFSLTPNTIPQELVGPYIANLTESPSAGPSMIVPEQDPDRMINFLEDEFASKQKKSMARKILGNRQNQSGSPPSRKLTQSPTPGERKNLDITSPPDSGKQKMNSQAKLAKIMGGNPQEAVQENSVEVSRDMIVHADSQQGQKSSLYAQMKQQSQTKLRSVKLRPQIQIQLLCKKPSVFNRLGFTVRASVDSNVPTQDGLVTRFAVSPVPSLFGSTHKAKERISKFHSTSRLDPEPVAMSTKTHRIHWIKTPEIKIKPNYYESNRQSLGLLTGSSSFQKSSPLIPTSSAGRCEHSYLVGTGQKQDKPYLQSQSKSRKELQQLFRINHHRHPTSSS